MIKGVFLILSLLFYVSFCAIIGWTPSGQNNLFSNLNNWTPQNVPGSSDVALIPYGSTVILTGSGTTTVQEIQFIGGAGTQTTFSVLDAPNTPTLNLQNLTFGLNANFVGTVNFIVGSGCTVAVSTYTNFNGATVNFSNYGMVTINPRVTASSTLSNNAQGNNVVFIGTLPNIFSVSTSLPQGFSFQQNSQTFLNQAGLGPVTLTFNYQETIPSSGWVVNNNGFNVVNFQFNNGLNIAGAITVANSSLSIPSATFDGSYNLTNGVTFNVNPTFSSSNGVYFSGSTLTFVDKSASFNTPLVGGLGGVTFSLSVLTSSAVSFLQTTYISNPNIVFSGTWTFNGGSSVYVSYNASVSFNQNYILNTNLVFNLQLNISGGFNITLGAQGSFSIYDGLNATTDYTWNFQPNFYCHLPQNTFALIGNAQTFNFGFQVYGCVVTTQNQITVAGGLIVTFNGNTTLPLSNLLIIQNTPTFSGSSNNSITLQGNWQTNSGNNWVVDGVELIITGSLSVQQNTNFTGSGIITLVGGVTFSSGNNIGIIFAFNSGNYTISSSGLVNFNSPIILRNAILTGTAEIWFNNGLFYLTKGVSIISNPIFRLKRGVSTNYLYDGISPNIGAQLYIAGSGSNSRYVEGSVISSNNVNVIFQDQVLYNSSITINGTNGGVTFMNQSTSIQGGYQINYAGNIYLNGSVNQWSGQGYYILNDQVNLYLLGSFNPASAGFSSGVVANGSVNVILSANVNIGSNVVFNGNLNTFDVDGNSIVASQTLTLEGNRLIPSTGSWSFGANIIVLGNLAILSGTNILPPGFLQINGNLITVGASITFYNQFILNSATTIVGYSNSAVTLTLAEASTPYTTHGLTLPAVTVVSPVTLQVGDGLTLLGAVASGQITGNGAFSLVYSVLSTTASTTISTFYISLSGATLTGSGSYTLQPTVPLLLSGVVTAFTTTTYSQNLNIVSAVNLTGISFTANPFNIYGNAVITFLDVRTINSTWITSVNLVFNNDVNITTNGSFSGSGILSFYSALTLGASLTITTNNVIFGLNQYSLVIISGNITNPPTLNLNNQQVTVVGTVVSGGALIVSASTSSYIHNIVGGSPGVIPPEWTWSNTIQIGQINVTGARTLTNPLILTNNLETAFPGGVTLNGNGSFTYDNIANTNNSLRVETSFTTNTVTVIPYNIMVSISGASFNFYGTNVLSINGTFNCQTSITFNTSVTFGYSTSAGPNPFNIANYCYLLGSSSLIINRAVVQLLFSNSSQNLYANTPITFGLLPPLSTVISSANSNNTFLFNGALSISGNNFQVSASNIYFGAITITTSQNSTLTGLNPNATLTFSSNSSVVPTVSFLNPISQVITLNGPIIILNAVIGPNANFVGSGSNGVFFVDSITFNSGANQNSVYYSFNTPIAFYVQLSTTTFTFNTNNNFININILPNTQSPFGYSAPSFLFTGTSSVVKFNYNGTLTVGDVTLSGTSTLRLSSGTFKAGTFTVNPLNTLWVDTATLSVNNLIFSANGTSYSNFQFTIAGINPTPVSSQYTFYQGNAIVSVVNYIWNGTSTTVISSNTANNNALFVNLYGSPGYIYSETRNGGSILFSATNTPTVSPFPTQSNGPSPAVSSSSIIKFNFLLIAFIFFLFTMF